MDKLTLRCLAGILWRLILIRFVVGAALIFGLENAAYAEPLDASNFSEYELQIHRIAWCGGLGKYAMSMNDYDQKSIIDIKILLRNQDFFEKDKYQGQNVASAVYEEWEKKIIFADFVYTEEMFQSCYDDAKAILKEEWIPRIDYAK